MTAGIFLLSRQGDIGEAISEEVDHECMYVKSDLTQCGYIPSFGSRARLLRPVLHCRAAESHEIHPFNIQFRTYDYFTTSAFSLLAPVVHCRRRELSI